MQSETAVFSPVPPPGVLAEAYASSLTLAYSVHYMTTRRHPQNRNYRAYRIAVTGERATVTGNMYRNVFAVLALHPSLLLLGHLHHPL